MKPSQGADWDMAVRIMQDEPSLLHMPPNIFGLSLANPPPRAFEQCAVLRLDIAVRSVVRQRDTDDIKQLRLYAIHLPDRPRDALLACPKAGTYPFAARRINTRNTPIAHFSRVGKDDKIASH